MASSSKDCTDIVLVVHSMDTDAEVEVVVVEGAEVSPVAVLAAESLEEVEVVGEGTCLFHAYEMANLHCKAGV